MTELGPRLVAWTDHALVKAELLRIARIDVESAILEGHARRTRNTGAADWLITSGGIAIAYSYPVNDELTALVVTLWRRG